MIDDRLLVTTQIPQSLAGLRIDQALAQLFPEYSRARLSEWLKAGGILVDRKVLKPKERVKGGEQLIVDVLLENQGEWQAQALDIDIIFEDEDIIIVNKAAGLVVHPGAGNPDKTLVNALLYHAPRLQKLPRAGIIHRLDKETTGLLIIAKTLQAHTFLIDAMQRRTIKRHYLALTHGQFISGGTVDAPIARHPKQRIKMAVVRSGKQAITHYRIKQQYHQHCLLDIELDTGRTHQIRVHMQHIRHPIVGDPLYNLSNNIKLSSPELQTCFQQLKRQALHAYKLAIPHPIRHDILTFKAPLPEDFAHLLSVLDMDNE